MKPKYKSDKRQKEVARKQKQERKQKEKLERKERPAGEPVGEEAPPR